MYVYNFHLAMIYFFIFRKNSTQTANKRQKQKNPSIKQAKQVKLATKKQKQINKSRNHDTYAHALLHRLRFYPQHKHKRMFFAHMYHTTKMFIYVFFVPNAYR